MHTHLRAAVSVFVLTSLPACDDSDAAADPGALTADAGESADAARGTKSSGSAAAAPRIDASSSREHAQDAGVAAPSAPAEDRQSITLRFQAQVGDEPFACGRNYAAVGSTSQTITPQDLRLFIQDVALVDDKGNEVPVTLDTRDPWQTPEVALLDFEDASGDCFGNADTNTEITGVVPKRTYRALRFSNGVPDKLNHSDPKTFPAPLKTPGMSWNWLLGLRFLRFEVATRLPADQADLDAGADAAIFALHIGSTACSGSQSQGNISCSKPNRSRVELKDFVLDKSEIVLDVSKLLGGNDLSKTVECHAASAVCEPMFEALGVDYATGKPTKDQSVFRLK